MGLRNIGGLWKNDNKESKTVLSGTINDMDRDIKIKIFKNEEKEKDQPDYRICVVTTDKEKKETAQHGDEFGGF